MFFLRAGIALGCVLALAVPSSAQQTVDVGSVSGRVVDQMQMVIPGASVVATHKLTNVAAAATPMRMAASDSPIFGLASTKSR